MKKTFLISLLFGLFLISSCKDTARFLSSITGSAYEVLVVMNQKEWKTEPGRTLDSKLEAAIIGLPQVEPNLSVSWCTPSDFNSMLKPTRNIVLADIDPKKYTKASITFSKDRWASPQAVVRITAPDDTSFTNYVSTHGEQIVNYLVKAELDRNIEVLKSNKNKDLMDMVYKKFGISILIPAHINKYKVSENAIWVSTGTREARQDLLIYSTPYSNQNQLNEENLLRLRDSIAGKMIPGPVANSYMSTEYKYDKPVYKAIAMDDNFCAEIRGLWRMKGNTLMGGPFVSHSRVDEINQKIITIEGFVYAPSVKKRTHIRQLESLLYTVKLPVMLNDVVIEGSNK